MPVSRERKLLIAKRRTKVADLYLQGNTQCKIAEQIGIKQSTVCNDLKRIKEAWRDSAVRDFDLSREIELKRIDRVESEAWAAWERSQKPSQTAVTDDNTIQRKTKRTLKNQHGDPRFLDIVQKCIAARRALLGLDAPTRTEIKTEGITIHERRDRITTIVTTLRDRGGTHPVGAGSGGDEPRVLCTDSQSGTVVTSTTPQLPGPGDS